MFILVAYDIADKKRLRKVAKAMKSYGTRVQLSVFECIIDKGELPKLLSEIKGLTKPREDKVQLYLLCEACRLRIELCGPGNHTTIPDVYIC